MGFLISQMQRQYRILSTKEDQYDLFKILCILHHSEIQWHLTCTSDTHTLCVKNAETQSVKTDGSYYHNDQSALRSLCI